MIDLILLLQADLDIKLPSSVTKINTKEIPSTKSQKLLALTYSAQVRAISSSSHSTTMLSFEDWDLEFLWCLEFGVWNFLRHLLCDKPWHCNHPDFPPKKL